MKHGCDVIVVGAGPVGSSLALALGSAGMDICLVEAAPRSAADAEARVFAVTQASQRLFMSLGAWETMLTEGANPYREMHVWDALGGGSIHFDCAQLGSTDLGHIVSQRVMQSGIRRQLQAMPRVQCIQPAAVTELRVEPDSVAVTLDNGDELRGRLVVGADGADSRVRAAAGLAARIHAYDQRALVASVATASPHCATAWQRFLPTGPLAFLPLGDGRSSIVWSTTPEQTEQLMSVPEDQFRETLGESFEFTLGAITDVGPRAAFPLRRLRAPHYVTHRVALVGDAAHCIHPLAGQGLNLGLLDGAALAEIVVESVAAGRDPGRRVVLRRYERWRKGDNLAVSAAMDGLRLLFASALPPLPWVRSRGLELTDRIPSIKRLLMNQAMGVGGELPRLSRGIPLSQVAQRY